MVRTVRRLLSSAGDASASVVERLGQWFAAPVASISAYECSECGTLVDDAASCPECGGTLDEVRWYFTGDYW